MEQKAENPIRLLEGRDVLPLIQAYFELCHLKQLYRQGWLRRGVTRERCESVAEHSFGVAALALWLSEAYYPDLDSIKVMRMALLHDFGEVYAGDIIPGDPLSPDEKRRREADSVAQVFSRLPGGQAYVALWEEFEAGDSPEALFVRQVDRLEMGLQAAVYTAQGYERMGEFIVSAREGLVDKEMVALLNAATEASAR